MIPVKARGGSSGGSPRHQQAVTQAPPSRVVPKPVPASQLQDARGYQIEQLKRRYSPERTDLEDGGTGLAFRLVPSDPDFPFELAYLECDLRVPAAYPSEPPVLHIRNKDIPRGFSINIERGWEKLVREKRGATLLAFTNDLDKNLEAFLSEQKAETVKLMKFKGSHSDSPRAGSSVAESLAQAPRPYIPQESFTQDEMVAAKVMRAQETRQLEARMGRLPLYHKSSDGIVYTLPLEPKRRYELPFALRHVDSVQLIVPLLYPLQPLRVLLNDVDSEYAEGIEEMFTEKAVEQKQMTLMSHLNYLAQNIHAMAKQARSKPQHERSAEGLSGDAAPVDTAEQAAAQLTSLSLQDDKSHVKVIPRPPEWSFVHSPDGADTSDDTDFSDDDGESDDEGGAAVGPGPSFKPAAQVQTAARGTSMSFPLIELHGVDLLEVKILAISIKCERCKTANDLGGLTDNVEKSDRCRKCAVPFAAKFRAELVSLKSTRAGFIDVSGGTVVDLLPSTFVPTCGRCSATCHGLVCVPGDAVTNVCRECHQHFTFKLPQVKFQAHTPGSALSLESAPPRRRQEKLGLHAGEPLPDRGACGHYRRSYRWFRFSCCEKVFPCDKCHDEAGGGHANEWANRMICGFCSREQNYSPESCAFCGRSVIGRRGKGYWEGGKGTRNRVLMRRKDKRKFRRVGGTAEAGWKKEGG